MREPATPSGGVFSILCLAGFIPSWRSVSTLAHDVRLITILLAFSRLISFSGFVSSFVFLYMLPTRPSLTMYNSCRFVSL